MRHTQKGPKTHELQGFGGQKILYSAGKTLGGGSTRNSLTYHRSIAGAFKKWAAEVGDASYEWNNLLPYFMRSVEFKEPRNDVRPANASTTYDLSATSKEGGPLKVSYPNHANAYSTYAIKALNELGLHDTKGSISGKLIGYAYTANSIDRETQTRSSSETSFLRYALEKTTNLNVYKSTLAKKVLFNGTRATGVVVDTAGVQYVLSAAKEVIVSAGAVSLNPWLCYLFFLHFTATLPSNSYGFGCRPQRQARVTWYTRGSRSPRRGTKYASKQPSNPRKVPCSYTYRTMSCSVHHTRSTSRPTLV